MLIEIYFSEISQKTAFKIVVFCKDEKRKKTHAKLNNSLQNEVVYC